MISKTRNYFTGGHTAQGFYSLMENIVEGLAYTYILQGGPGSGTSTLLKEIAEWLKHEGYDIDVIHSPSDINSLDGVIIPDINIGIINGAAPYHIIPKAIGIKDELIHLDEGWNKSILEQNKKEIWKLIDDVNFYKDKAYQHFAAARDIHLEREDVYLQGMNFDKANDVTEGLLDQIFQGSIEVEMGREKHLFFGAATPHGVINYIDNLTELTNKRYIIKGRPGSGKSTLLKKIVAKSNEYDLNTEVYQCGFDPNSLDMVIIPQLRVAILDGTSPHEIEASRSGDEILDMYQLCFDRDIDFEYKAQLEEINVRYKTETKQGILALAEAKAVHDELKDYYLESVDFNLVEQKKNYIKEETWRRINSI